MMSMCCDHRLITPNGTMGLNEVQLGIPVPKFWAQLMQRLLGVKAADKLLLTGKMINAQEVRECMRPALWRATGAIDSISPP